MNWVSLKDFFLEKIGISEEYWEDSEGELREASEKAGRRNLENIYNRDRLDSFSPGVEERIAEGIERKDEYLGFLAIEILKSELERKDVILESLTGLAFESLSTYNYPIMDVLSHMIREIEGVGGKHPEWFGWKDTFSSRESFENVFEWVMESDFDVPKKTSVFVCMIVSLKEAKMRDLAKKITTLFFRSGEIPRKVKDSSEERLWKGSSSTRFRSGRTGTACSPRSKNRPLKSFPKNTWKGSADSWTQASSSK